MKEQSIRAKRNRTTFLTEAERAELASRLVSLSKPMSVEEIEDKTIVQDMFLAVRYLPTSFVDLLFVDPPYNLNKQFNSGRFKEMNDDDYERWVDSWLSVLLRLLKPTASVYICSDWKSSTAIYRVMSKHLLVRNRITWEREKGRGANSNWKNCSEDIWFGTVSKTFHFNPNAVKLRRKVIAPYRDSARRPKDWSEESGAKFRETFPSNLWTDLTVPFWSMSENTDHPTQKPEKLLAKIILASSRPGDLVFDPFLGSGTTSVVAKKLGRRYSGIEIDADYACLAEKRLAVADAGGTIQGYNDGHFWERNSLNSRRHGGPSPIDHHPFHPSDRNA